MPTTSPILPAGSRRQLPFPRAGSIGIASRKSLCERAGGLPKRWCWEEGGEVWLLLGPQPEKPDLMDELRKKKAAIPTAEHIWFTQPWRALGKDSSGRVTGLCVAALLCSHKGLDFWTFQIRIDFVYLKKKKKKVYSIQGLHYLLAKTVTLGISAEYANAQLFQAPNRLD